MTLVGSDSPSEGLEALVSDFITHNPHLIKLYKDCDRMQTSGEVFKILEEVRQTPPAQSAAIIKPLQRIIDRKCSSGIMPGFPAEYEIIDATSTHNVILLVTDHALSGLKKAFIQGTFLQSAQIRLQDVINFYDPASPTLLICFDHQRMIDVHGNADEVQNIINIGKWHYLLPYAQPSTEHGNLLSIFENKKAVRH